MKRQRTKPVFSTTLVGTPKQVAWAELIRFDILGSECPPDVVETLLKVQDSSWWIANRNLLKNGQFKEPAPYQLVGCAPEEGDASVKRPPVDCSPAPESQARGNDAAAWAASVSRHPKMAEAAILAVLSRLYKDDMRSVLKAKAKQVLKEADFEVTRDIDAINRMLS